MTTAPLDILLVDDEPLARARLASLLSQCGQPRFVQAANAVQALQCVTHGKVDLVLLDIHMPGTDGLNLAQALAALAHPPAVVFVTAHAEHAVQAFELEAVDYLTKPVRLERLQVALQKVERLLRSANRDVAPSQAEALVIQQRGRTERVPIEQVLYLKAELKYLTVRTRSHSYILEGALSDLEQRYSGRFVRIHRNALVARHAVRALERSFERDDAESWVLRLDGIDEPLWVSRRQLALVRELLVSV